MPVETVNPVTHKHWSDVRSAESSSVSSALLEIDTDRINDCHTTLSFCPERVIKNIKPPVSPRNNLNTFNTYLNIKYNLKNWSEFVHLLLTLKLLLKTEAVFFLGFILDSAFRNSCCLEKQKFVLMFQHF